MEVHCDCWVLRPQFVHLDLSTWENAISRTGYSEIEGGVETLYNREMWSSALRGQFVSTKSGAGVVVP